MRITIRAIRLLAPFQSERPEIAEPSRLRLDARRRAVTRTPPLGRWSGWSRNSVHGVQVSRLAMRHHG